MPLDEIAIAVIPIWCIELIPDFAIALQTTNKAYLASLKRLLSRDYREATQKPTHFALA